MIRKEVKIGLAAAAGIGVLSAGVYVARNIHLQPTYQEQLLDKQRTSLNQLAANMQNFSGKDVVVEGYSKFILQYPQPDASALPLHNPADKIIQREYVVSSDPAFQKSAVYVVDTEVYSPKQPVPHPLPPAKIIFEGTVNCFGTDCQIRTNKIVTLEFLSRK